MLGKEDEEDNTYINLPDLNLQRQKKGEKAKGNCDEEGAYSNLYDLDPLRKKNAEAKAGKNTQIRLILILMVLLIILFLVQVVVIGILFTFYKNMAEEQSHLRETGENMAKEQSRLRETDKNITEEQSRLRETDKNMAEEQSRLRETGIAQSLCVKPWMHYGLSCYYKSTNVETLNSAKSECEKKRAHLVIINGEDEMNFIRGVSENRTSYWIDLKKVNGAWEWSDGTSYDMTPK
ncbi:asialoglycoprotein receptor 1-like [Rana temporaria]|uniref:asialoglycoprotein receptor 1-like n=1 Tax=Rana temporaria TaxID=8407 RepID=UPI001AAD81B3|nr:asialoglycoprotein receptor 1-like [Rana temporaria]